MAGEEHLSVLECMYLTDSVTFLQKVKSSLESPGWHETMFDIHLWRLQGMHCPGHAGVKGNDWADYWWARVFSSLRHTLSVARKPTISHQWSPGGDGLRKMKCLTISHKRVKKSQSIRPTLELFQRQFNTMTTSERWGGVHMGFLGRKDTTLNWTDHEADRLAGKATWISEKIWNVGELETLSCRHKAKDNTLSSRGE